jgi:hypothetical protein
VNKDKKSKGKNAGQGSNSNPSVSSTKIGNDGLQADSSNQNSSNNKGCCILL